jgi:hypothetical protein
LAIARIDDDSEAVSLSDPADIINGDLFSFNNERAHLLQVSDHGPFYSQQAEFGLVEFPSVRFCDSPADGFYAVLKENGLYFKMTVIHDNAFLIDRVFHYLDRFMIHRAVAKPLEIFVAACGIVAMDLMSHFVQVEPHEDRGEAKAMITVEMGDENA